MARPKKEKNLHACVLPPIRCTEDERATIRANAARLGMTMSEYVRQMALGGKVVIKESKADFDNLDQLRRIGVNLNQLTRKAHVRDEFPEGLSETFDQLQTVFDRLLNSA